MKKRYDPDRLTTVKDLEEMEVRIITGISDVLKDYATKADVKNLATKEDVKNLETKVTNLETKVDHVSYDVSDIKRRVIDLETDRIGRQEFIKLKQKIIKG